MKHRSLLKKFHYLYKITRFDGAYYIGIHSTDDLNDGYFGSGQRLRQSVKKHGREAHAISIVEMIADRERLLLRERETVSDELLRDPLCLNLRRGGGATAEEVSGSTRGRLSSSAKRAEVWRNAMSPEANAKRKASLTGKKKTPEHVRRSAEARLANMSDETRFKLGSANRNKSWYNNGICSKLFLTAPSDWVRGRLV